MGYGNCALGLTISLLAVLSGCSSSADSGNDNGAGAPGGGSSSTARAGAGGSVATSAGGSGNGSAGSVALAGNGGSSNASGGTSAIGGSSNGGSTSVAGAGGGASTARPKIRTVGYLPDYRGSLMTWATMDWSLVSYVDLAFAAVSDAGDVSYSDPAIPQFTAAAHAAGAKVCLAFGGGTTTSGLGSLANQITAANRGAFIAKITAFASTNGLDCIDVDFEGSGVNSDYEGFVTALSTALKAQGKEVSAAVGSWFGSSITSGALAAFDFINVMAYDIHNPYGTQGPIQSSSIPDSQTEMDYWVGRGVAKTKLNFGVPFYGFEWKPGASLADSLTYAQILSTYGATAAASDEIQQNGTTVYFNSKATIQAKAKLAEGYGGVMAWELGQDATGTSSLLRAIHDAL